MCHSLVSQALAFPDGVTWGRSGPVSKEKERRLLSTLWRPRALLQPSEDVGAADLHPAGPPASEAAGR